MLSLKNIARVSFFLSIIFISSNAMDIKKEDSANPKSMLSHHEEKEKIIDFINSHSKDQFDMSKSIDPTNGKTSYVIIARNAKHPAGDLITIFPNELIIVEDSDPFYCSIHMHNNSS